jgi:tetratricopeptide (TPR) repeat protein
MTSLPYRLAPLAAAFAFALSACAQQPVAGDVVAQAQPRTTSKPAPADKPRAELPGQVLTPQLLYQYLVAEMAAHRGQAALAAQAYVDLARKTRDPRIARRATEVAFYSRQYPIAVEAATLWLQSEPESVQARQTLASILVSSGTLEEVRPHLEVWLAGDPDRVGQAFLQLNTLLARHADKAAVAKLVTELVAQNAKLPEAQLAGGQAAWSAGQADAALASVRQALRLRPDWELAALFQGQILQRKSNKEAIGYFGDYLRTYPKARDVRLTYARLLVTEKRFDDARREFGALMREFPDNADVALAVGLLAMQANDFDAAEASFRKVLELEARDPDTVRYYLGQLSEERKRFDDALGWYRGVARGDQLVPAQARIAGILAKQGKVPEARAYLQGIKPQSLEQRVLLTQAEAHILRDASAYREAFDVLSRAIEKMPDTPDLLYDLAMAAEKVDRLDVLETNLRRLIELRPDHAHAYNALGYTLADRTDRLEEAYVLIERALKLAPDDPFIMDSMGWVLFRLGRTAESYDYLARAFKVRPDPEIAAHYGEVLWAQGRRSEAERVWRTALKDHPDNEVLRAVLKKFLP